VLAALDHQNTCLASLMAAVSSAHIYRNVRAAELHAQETTKQTSMASYAGYWHATHREATLRPWTNAEGRKKEIDDIK
jgi:hypothetical protein